MRHIVIVIPATAILAVAVLGAQTPSAQTAGERYSSVKVLREIPSSQIIPTMAFIANSLGVTCAHCHTTEYVSDEKPAKEKARAMIRLQRSINEQYYGGKQVVTCQTCHAGQVTPQATPNVDASGWNRVAAPVSADPL